METERMAGDEEDQETDGVFDSVGEVLRDRFRLSSISIAHSQARRSRLQISDPVVACLSDLAFQFSEQLAKDLERFARHAGRKSVNTEDVLLSAHRNEHLAMSLRSFCDELKLKEPQSVKKRKKLAGKEAKATNSAVHITDT